MPALSSAKGAAARTQICATLHATTAAEAEQQIRQAAEDGADLAELRLDLLTSGFDAQRDLQRLLSTSKLQIIVACRPSAHGGMWSGTEAQRVALLMSAAEHGAAYVEAELDIADNFVGGPDNKSQSGGGDKLPEGTGLIVSHAFPPHSMPDEQELQATVRKLQAAGADVARVAATASDVSDSLRMLALLRMSSQQAGPKPLIPVCLGERGLPSKVLAAKYGAFLAYGALREGVPGEPSVRQLIQQYRLPQHTPDTRVYGIAGTNVAPDRNYVAHNAMYEALNMDAVYLPFRVDDFPRFLYAFSAPDFAGFSVTMPFKGQALAAAAEKDSIAQRIGAANTLVRKPDGSVKALNTDWVGVTAALEKLFGQPLALDGRRVAVVGTGGAGQAIAFAAAEAGAAQVFVADLLGEKAEALAASLGDRVLVASLDDINSGKVPADILANGSPIGMSPKVDAMAVTQEAIDAADVVFDAIYTPPTTQLLKVAEHSGKKVASGFDMFVGQAAYQFKLFTGREDDVADLMRQAVLPTL